MSKGNVYAREKPTDAVALEFDRPGYWGWVEYEPGRNVVMVVGKNGRAADYVATVDFNRPVRPRRTVRPR